MNKNKRMLIFTEIIGIIILILTYIIQVVLDTDFRIGAFIIIAYIFAFLIIVGRYKLPNMTEMMYKNKMIFR